MAEKRQPIRAIRGTRDILPPESSLFQFVEEQAREVFRLYNFQEIRTPIFEDTALFSRSVGEETDIVGKEMFTWEDRSSVPEVVLAATDEEETARQTGHSLTLRPENTAGVVRAFVQHQLGRKSVLQKLYYIGPQFRRERPQKGRFRQFYQIGAEALGPVSSGSQSPARDAEMISMLVDLLQRIDIGDFQVELNSIGSAEDRAAYNTELRIELAKVKHLLCKDCQRRAVTNPLRVLDCKKPTDQGIIRNLPQISTYLSPDSREHFENVQAILQSAGVKFTINPRMVRGLDYYTRTVFEIVHQGLGAQNAILGGGRYDGLSELLGGERAPGVGFAMGLDRLVMILEQRQGLATPVPAAFLAPFGKGMNREAAILARRLRSEGIPIELGDRNFKPRKSIEIAEKLGITHVIFIGENEVSSGEFAIRNIKTGKQVTLSTDKISDYLKD